MGLLKDNMLKDKVFASKLFKLTLPAAIQVLMVSLVNASDAFMLGHLDQNSMSAVSLATQIPFILVLFTNSGSGVESILGAQYFGKGDNNAIDSVYWLSNRFGIVASVIFCILCKFCPRQLMLIFTDVEELIVLGIDYLEITAFSYLLLGFIQSTLSLLKVTNHATTSAIISSGTVVLNIILNAIFIFGLFGAPRLEVKGAAVATVISNIVEIIALFVILHVKGYFKPSIKGLFKSNKTLRKDFYKYLLPYLMAGMFWGVGFTSYSTFMGHLGTDATGANSICAVVRDLICCICEGLAVGGGILVGNELGKGDLKKGKLYGDRLLVIGFTVGIISTILMLLSIPVTLKFVKLTDMAKEYLKSMMIIMSVYMIGRSVNSIVINGVFGAGGDTMFDMYSLAVCMWCIAIPLAALGTYVFNWNPILVYACTCLDEVGKIPWVMIHYKKYKWVKNLTKTY